MKRTLITAIFAVNALCASAAFAATSWVGPNTNLNVRSGPGTNYGVVGSLRACTGFDVVSWQNGWAQFTHNGNYYWVSGKYLINQPCDSYTPPKQNYTPPPPKPKY